MTPVKAILLTSALFVAPLAGMFTYGWAGHMEQVRFMQAYNVERYTGRSIDWNEVDTADLDFLVEAAQNEIFALPSGLGGLSDERDELRYAMTEVLFLIRRAGHQNTTPDQEILNEAVKAVADAQQRLYDAHNRFQSDWFFAMSQTL